MKIHCYVYGVDKVTFRVNTDDVVIIDRLTAKVEKHLNISLANHLPFYNGTVLHKWYRLNYVEKEANISFVKASDFDLQEEDRCSIEEREYRWQQCRLRDLMRKEQEGLLPERSDLIHEEHERNKLIHEERMQRFFKRFGPFNVPGIKRYEKIMDKLKSDAEKLQ